MIAIDLINFFVFVLKNAGMRLRRYWKTKYLWKTRVY